MELEQHATRSDRQPIPGTVIEIHSKPKRSTRTALIERFLTTPGWRSSRPD